MPDLPAGFDRADGLNGRLGTPTPAGAINADTVNGTGSVDDIPIEELPDSPTMERAEQATFTHRFRMSLVEATNRLLGLGMGTIRVDSYGNLFKVLSATITPERGGTAILTVIEEAASFDSPPDDFSIEPVELGVNIIKYPRYFYAFLGDGQGSETELQNQMVIRLLQDYMENSSAPFRNALTTLLEDSIGSQAGTGPQPPPWSSDSQAYPDTAQVSGTDMAKYAALEIIQKFWRGEETPYLVGYQIKWKQYYFRPPMIDPGGRIEDPMLDAVPQLPAYFWSPDFPPSDVTIFDNFPIYNPQCYSDDGTRAGVKSISWLRKSDEIVYQRTWFEITRTWIGSPFGNWDADLYAALERPMTPSDWTQIAPST